MRRALILLCILWLSLAWAAPLRVLFIGNSHTYGNDMPQLVADMAVAAKEPRTPEFKLVTTGGFTLQNHWENSMALKIIQAERWDYVVLQEQSSRIVMESSYYRTWARLFDQEIRKSGARTVLFMGWQRKDSLTRRYSAYDWITSTYELARQLGNPVLMAPIGLAWANAEAEKRDLMLYESDASHANLTGSYLTACVLYSTLYGKSPVGLPAPIEATQASFLQQIAWKTVNALEPAYRAP